MCVFTLSFVAWRNKRDVFRYSRLKRT